MSLLIAGIVAVGALLLVRMWIDRQARPTPGVVTSGVADDSGPDGMAPALLRPRAGLRWWWRSGALYSVSGQVWFESRVLHRQTRLDGFRLETRRDPSTAEAARWAPDTFMVLSLTSAEGAFDCAVYVEQESFVTSLFTASS